MFGIKDPWVNSRIRYVTDRAPHPGFSNTTPEQVEGLFLCMTPRSGSTFFGAVLRDNGLGEFMERFRVVSGSLEHDLASAKATNFEEYVASKIKRHRRGAAAAFKVDWPQFVPLYYLGAWQRFFSSSHFIYLTREDVLLQAISRHVGEATGIFHSTHLSEGKSLPADLPLDYAAIERQVVYLTAMMSAWERFFASEGIRPIRLTYEQLIKDLPGALHAIADATGRTLNAPLRLDNEFTQISTDLNDRLKDEFIAEYRRREYPAEQLTQALSAT